MVKDLLKKNQNALLEIEEDTSEEVKVNTDINIKVGKTALEEEDSYSSDSNSEGKNSNENSSKKKKRKRSGSSKEFDVARRESVKNEFSLVRQKLNSLDLNEKEEVLEDDEVVKKNTQLNLKLGKEGLKDLKDKE